MAIFTSRISVYARSLTIGAHRLGASYLPYHIYPLGSGALVGLSALLAACGQQVNNEASVSLMLRLLSRVKLRRVRR